MMTMGYILKMQEISSRADIDEARTVQISVEVFVRDRSADIAALYPSSQGAGVIETRSSFRCDSNEHNTTEMPHGSAT